MCLADVYLVLVCSYLREDSHAASTAASRTILASASRVVDMVAASAEVTRLGGADGPRFS